MEKEKEEDDDDGSRRLALVGSAFQKKPMDDGIINQIEPPNIQNFIIIMVNPLLENIPMLIPVKLTLTKRLEYRQG